MSISAGYSDRFYTASDGLRLHARIYGQPVADELPVICLSGLTRNARDFHGLALYLSSEAPRPRQVICFDYRGRGLSDYDPNWRNYTVLTEAQDVLAGLATLGIQHGAFIGASRGGLILHFLPALAPGMMKAAIFNDIGPVVEMEGLLHIRNYLRAAKPLKSFTEAEAAQRSAHSKAFPALNGEDWQTLARALYRDENGVPVLDFDPALVNTLDNLNPSAPLPDLWPQFESLSGIPLLAIRGENSTLLSKTTLEEMRNRHDGMETILVEGQGHTPLLETASLPQKIAGFLDRSMSGRQIHS
ncbi:alpha/beta hydrolase [Mesorhizobium sp. SB112]|uniref:alpha/beta fold hydrolase n=1 Tax=Mesorhizobium sp. SB112 TaxID=3151853 RepID=UPI0032648872